MVAVKKRKGTGKPISIPVAVCRALFGRPDATGLTRLAGDIGVDKSHLWRVLNGTRVPSVVLFRRLSDRTKISMTKLYSLLYED
jgi:transcriptional regulator with XRE-family HTH domain